MNGSDVEFLKKKFRQTFRAVMGPAKNIKLSNIPGPTPAQWRLFLEVTLCGCPRLVHVKLSRNEAITDATLQPFAALHDSLDYLNVSTSVGIRGSLEPLCSLTNCVSCTCGAGAACWFAGARDVESGGQGSTSWRRCRNSTSSTLAIRSLTRRPSWRGASGFCSCQRRRWRRNREVWWWAGVGSVGMATRRRPCGGPRMMGRWRQHGGCWLGWMVGEAWRWMGRGQAMGRHVTGGNPELPRRMVEVLLEYRAGANKGRHDGFAPLLFAPQPGSVQVAKLLVKKGADVNKSAKAGQTPLKLASFQGPQGRGGDASRRGRRQDSGGAGSDRTVDCALFRAP